MLIPSFTVDSPNVQYTDEAIKSRYQYQTNEIERDEAGNFTVRPTTHQYDFSVQRNPGKVGYAPSASSLVPHLRRGGVPGPGAAQYLQWRIASSITVFFRISLPTR